MRKINSRPRINILGRVTIYRNIATCARKHVSSPMLVVGLFRGLTKLLWLSSRKESNQKRRRVKEKGCKMDTFSWGWLLEVKI